MGKVTPPLILIIYHHFFVFSSYPLTNWRMFDPAFALSLSLSFFLSFLHPSHPNLLSLSLSQSWFPKILLTVSYNPNLHLSTHTKPHNFNSHTPFTTTIHALCTPIRTPSPNLTKSFLKTRIVPPPPLPSQRPTSSKLLNNLFRSAKWDRFLVVPPTAPHFDNTLLSTVAPKTSRQNFLVQSSWSPILGHSYICESSPSFIYPGRSHWQTYPCPNSQFP